MTRVGALLPRAWAVVLAVLMLGPALAPGYVLSYDMVWVPDLALRGDFLGLGSGLPRAVPSDAVVAVLDEVVPGMLLQKLMLVSVLVTAGLGALRLTGERSVIAGLVAVTLFEWNPFVVERLVIGHWPVLVGYAVLPWVVLAARAWRTTGRSPVSVWWLLPLGSLSASAGLVTALVLLAFGVSRDLRRSATMLLLVVAANAPWVMAGLLHAGSATTDPAGATRFALFGEGTLPAPLAAVSLGGIWNSEVVPASRTGVAGWLFLLLLLVLALLGARRWAARWTEVEGGRRDVLAFAACWLVGWGVAVLTWAAPALMGWLVGHVPGAGLLRDGSRLLALCAISVVPLAASGAARVLATLPSAVRPALGVALVLAPVALMPDAAYGVSGRLTAVEFPYDFARARTAVGRAVTDGNPGDVLVLPLSSYRQPGWNDGHKVLDPVGRYLQPDFVASDELYVSGERIAGEDPRVREVARALALPTPSARGLALAGLGIGLVVGDRDSDAPKVTANPLFVGDLLVVGELGDAQAKVTPGAWPVLMAWAWSLFAGCLLVGAGRLVRKVAKTPRVD